MFSTMRNRNGTLSRAGEMLLRLFSVNRHAQQGVDRRRRIAVVGGLQPSATNTSAPLPASTWMRWWSAPVKPGRIDLRQIRNSTSVIPLSALAGGPEGRCRAEVRAQNAATMLTILKRVRASATWTEFLSGAAMRSRIGCRCCPDPADKVEGGDESRWLVRPRPRLQAAQVAAPGLTVPSPATADWQRRARHTRARRGRRKC